MKPTFQPLLPWACICRRYDANGRLLESYVVSWAGSMERISDGLCALLWSHPRWDEYDVRFCPTPVVELTRAPELQAMRRYVTIRQEPHVLDPIKPR